MKPRYRLTCTKSGREWDYQTESAAMWAARYLGLKDYTIEAI